MTRIEIDADGRRINLQHDGPLADVLGAAVQAWRDTGPTSTAAPESTEVERIGSVGFSAALEIAQAADRDMEVTA